MISLFKQQRVWAPLLFVLGVRAAVNFAQIHFFPQTVWYRVLATDVWVWMKYFQANHEGFIPSLDYSVAYPVLTGYFFWILSPIITTQDPYRFFACFAITTFIIDAINVVLFVLILEQLKVRTLWKPVFLFALNLTMLTFSAFRIEGLLMLFVLSGYLAHLKGRFYLSATLWGVGFNIKWFSLFTETSRDYLMWRKTKETKKWIKISLLFLGVCLLPNLLAALVGYLSPEGTHNLKSAYVYHAGRKISVDTLLGIYQMWKGTSAFSFVVDKLSLLGVVAVFFAWPSPSLPKKIVLICVTMLICNKIYSAQFNLWFYPFLIVLIATAKVKKEYFRLLLLFCLLDLFNFLVCPVAYSLAYNEMGALVTPGIAGAKGGPWAVFFSATVVTRAFLLALLFWQIAFCSPIDDEKETLSV